jgi:predicted alpha/beta-hydrolase family hydrolase
MCFKKTAIFFMIQKTKTKSFKINVTTETGSISAVSIIPAKPIAILAIAHGAGAGMNHPFMETLSNVLAVAGIGSIRFNFPFMEQQKKRPDVPAVAHKTIAAVIDKASILFPDLPLFASGKSFGGRMTSQYLADNPGSIVKGIIFFGFPLHAPGKPSIERSDHLKKIKIPMLFLQGSRDEFAEWKLIEKVCRQLRKTKLVRIEGANHAFKAGKLDTMSILVNETKSWIEKIP